MSNIKGTALITGASTGIGAVYADRLARRDHDLVLVARDGTALETVASTLRSETGVNVEVLPADVVDPAGQAKVVDRLAGDDIGIFVNNAGIAESGPTIRMEPRALAHMLNLNVVAAAVLAQAAGVAMAARGAGTIINMASIASVAGARPGVSVGYSSSKAFFLAFSEALETELSPLGVTVQAVLPGATRTPIWKKSGLDVDAVIGEDGIMDVDEMVDAALTGLDRGERVTIPGLVDTGLWDSFVEARTTLLAHMPARHAAPRYR
jgi:uncharacterized protein